MRPPGGWGACPFDRPGRRRWGSYLALALCAGVAAAALERCLPIVGLNHEAGDFLPMQHPKGWRYELSITIARPMHDGSGTWVSVPDPGSIRRNELHRSVERVVPLFLLVPAATAWALAPALGARQPVAARVGAIAVHAALAACLAVMWQLGLHDALCGD